MNYLHDLRINDVVTELAEQWYETLENKQISGDWPSPFSYTLDGYCVCIKFMGIVLWDSDYDDREYLSEEEDEQEDLKTYLIKKLLQLSHDISTAFQSK